MARWYNWRAIAQRDVARMFQSRQKRGAETEKAAGRHAALGMVSRLGLEPRAFA